MVTDKRKEKWKKAKKHWLRMCKEGDIRSFGELSELDDGSKIQPSDHCYNHTNIADLKKGFPHYKKGYLCFMRIDENKYEYIGFGQESTLGIDEVVETFWLDNRKNTTLVGIWYKGKYYVPKRRVI